MAEQGNNSLRRGLLLAIPGIIGLFVMCYLALPYNTPRFGSLASDLRSERIFILAFPKRNGFVEKIEVYVNKTAIRAFYPLQHPRAYSEIILDDDIWEEIAAIRRDWCAKSPTFRSTTEDTLVYQVAIQCNRTANPVFHIPLDQLPQSLATLIATVPPPPTVRDGRLVAQP